MDDMMYNEKPINMLFKGDNVQNFFLLKKVEFRNGKNDTRFVDFTFADKSGEINGKLWNYMPQYEKLYQVGRLVKVRGVVNQWKEQLQLRVDKIRLINDTDNINPANYVPVAPHDPVMMYEKLMNYINAIVDTDIKNVVFKLINDRSEEIMYYPAAKLNHHAVRAGLLYHLTTMLDSALGLLNIYTYLNTDLVYAGVILHDIEKLSEMKAGELGLVTDYTVEGKLLGHIVMGAVLLDQVGKEVNAPQEKIDILKHMIISHHYHPEYGSPIKPMFPEAELLHYLDIIDSRLYDMKKVTDEIASGTFSERIWSLENRMVYHIPDELFDKE